MANTIENKYHDSLAHEALSFYNGESWQCRFIRHNENLTYKATDAAGKSYLLRLHMPAVKGFEGAAQDEAAINSELVWLDALRRDTGMQLQRPVENKHGKVVTLLGHPGLSRPIPATLMTWVEGSPVTWQEENADEITVQLAHAVSAFHSQSKGFHPPQGFTRPSYDNAKLASSLATLAGGVDAGIIEAPDFKLFEQACEYIHSLMGRLGKGRDDWGLIHADWIGNLIAHGKSITPIDFSLSGFGPYTLDLAICICNLNKPLRPVFIGAFGKEVIEAQQRHIEAFTIYIIVVAASKFIFTDLWGDWFTRRFPLIAQQYCTALVEGRPFLMEI